MIWKTAEPTTTKTNNAKSHGPTGVFDSDGLFVFGTLPRCVILLLCTSLARFRFE